MNINRMIATNKVQLELERKQSTEEERKTAEQEHTQATSDLKQEVIIIQMYMLHDFKCIIQMISILSMLC